MSIPFQLQKYFTTPTTYLTYTLLQSSSTKLTYPTILFVPGLYSTFTTSLKAQRLYSFAKSKGYGFLAYDHFGQGSSSGDLAEITVTKWVQDLETVWRDILNQRDIVIVASSMGVWLSLILASRWYSKPGTKPTQSSLNKRNGRVKGIIGIGGSIHFTQKFMSEIPESQARQLESSNGMYLRPSRGENWVLNYPIKTGTIPIELIHGLNDLDVDWTEAVSISEKVETEDVRVTLVKGGDHRLSRLVDLNVLEESLERVLSKARGDEVSRIERQ
ncbi:Alpha/Beta hydrolase protein [Paraphysoderma sedebokerense]|nr:Alpha/Beta hydrolase protein [Paraphysoderma sedebokerense]